MNFYKLVIICQLLVKFVRNHFGTCSNHQPHMNVKGKSFIFKLFFIDIVRLIVRLWTFQLNEILKNAHIKHFNNLSNLQL